MDRVRVEWLVAALLTGCTVTTSTIRTVASQDLRCAPEDLSVEDRGDGEFYVSGCDVEAHYTCSRGELAAMRCEKFRPTLPVAERELRVRAKAVRLLECDESALEVEKSSEEKSYVVKGCGKRIAFECQTREDDCCAFTRPGAQELESLPVVPPKLRAAIKRGRERSEGGERSGTLSKAEIQETITDEIAQVSACYEAAHTTPPLAGVVVIQFIIEAQGLVRTAAVLQSSLGARTVEDCLVEVMQRLHFAEPKGKGVVVVSYPFIFLPENERPAACE